MFLIHKRRGSKGGLFVTIDPCGVRVSSSLSFLNDWSCCYRSQTLFPISWFENERNLIRSPSHPHVAFRRWCTSGRARQQNFEVAHDLHYEEEEFLPGEGCKMNENNSRNVSCSPLVRSNVANTTFYLLPGSSSSLKSGKMRPFLKMHSACGLCCDVSSVAHRRRRPGSFRGSPTFRSPGRRSARDQSCLGSATPSRPEAQRRC